MVCSGFTKSRSTHRLLSQMSGVRLSTSSSIPPNHSSPAAHTKSDSLSTGAIAAIGVVVPVLVIAALAWAAWWLRRRSKKNHIASQEDRKVDSTAEMDAGPEVQEFGAAGSRGPCGYIP